MSPNPIKIYFQNSFDKTLDKLEITDPRKRTYLIYPTKKIENYTNFDDIYRLWATPSIAGIRITYDEVIQNLVKVDQNAIPLWIKINSNSNAPIVLEISQRFRKKKQILERNPNNEIAPFEILEGSEVEFQLAEERKEAIRILFFQRLGDKNINRIIGDTIKYKELINMLSLHFEKYRFYPALYTHYKIDDERFSNLVIEKDFNANKFRLFKPNSKEETLKDNLDIISAIKHFAQNELNWKYKGITIEQESE